MSTKTAEIKKKRTPRTDAKLTTFDPAKHGFNFVNDFKNDFVPAFDITTSGLCGGMSYTALDYYFASRPIPRQDYRPANRTPLQSYLYDRQVTSLESNLDKWIEVSFNPGGARDSEFFNWGLQGSNGGRLEELRSFIDRGVPVPLGLKGDKSGDHQVVAIGYDLGRYKGDLGAFKEDLKIFVYDPNHPNKARTLIPDLSRQVYTHEEDSSKSWRTYFVDKNYAQHAPPQIPNPVYPNDGAVRELILSFATGGDDLRGGGDNINLTVNLFDGTQQFYPNINLSARWLSNYTENAQIVLSQSFSPRQLKNLVIDDTFGGGISGDNWDMNSVHVRAIGGELSQVLKKAGLHRFTGHDKQLIIPINDVPPAAPGLVTKMVLEILTGGDDLRGENDNLNIETRFSDGRTQLNTNVNGSAQWNNNSAHQVTIILNKPVRISEIKNMILTTTFTGGIGGDNWDMTSLTATAIGAGVNKAIAVSVFHRFTGDNRQLTVPVLQ